MKFKTPTFWYGDPPAPSSRAAAALLSPLSLVYRGLHALHQKTGPSPYRSTLPVLCVGNIVAGGSGKTPVALALLKEIQALNSAKAPCFLTRGYGGCLKGPVKVSPGRHTAPTAGDEALLLARAAPTIVSANRGKGAQLAEKSGHDLIIMDDGLQNPSLEKTLRLIVIDGSSGFGNGHLLPAGPLREPLSTGLEKADVFVLIGPDTRHIRKHLPAGRPVWQAHLRPHAAGLDKNTPYVGFTGIGRPEKFKNTLEQLGLSLADWRSFPDHHAFSAGELDGLDRLAATLGARLITTEKDAVRLPAGFPWRKAPVILPVEIQWETPEDVRRFLKDRLKQK